MNRRFTRRTALKMGLVGTFLVACRSARRQPFPEPVVPKRYGFMSSHDTSHGKLYDVIENWPDIRTREMTWIKMREGGKIIANARNREKLSVSRGFPLPFTRSRLHTHLVEGNKVFERKLASIPSPLDLNNFLHSALKYANNPIMLTRVSHTIPISYEGKGVGFVTMRIGDKLIKTMQIDVRRVMRDGDITSIKDAIACLGPVLKLLKQVDALEKKYEQGVGETDPFFAEYHDLLAELQKSGLQFRVTPRKGYLFQDGYFQPTS